MEITIAILEAVLNQEKPPLGLTRRQILERCRLGIGTQRLRWHLRKLEQLGLIYSLIDPNHRLRLLYYPGQLFQEAQPDGALMLDSKARIILAIIAQESTGLTFHQVLARCGLGLSSPQMVIELQRLNEKGLLRFEFDPKHARRFTAILG